MFKNINENYGDVTIPLEIRSILPESDGDKNKNPCMSHNPFRNQVYFASAAFPLPTVAASVVTIPLEIRSILPPHGSQYHYERPRSQSL